MYKFAFLLLWIIPVSSFGQHGEPDYADSVKYLTFLIEQYPNSPGYYSLRGYYKNILGDYYGAIRDYDKSLSIRPNNVDALVCRSESHYALSHHDEALTDIDNAIKLDQSDYYAYFLRARVEFVLGLYRVALWDYTQCIEMIKSERISDNEILSVAYFGRGYLKLEYLNDPSGCYDLSRSGELGVAKSYEYIREKCN